MRPYPFDMYVTSDESTFTKIRKREFGDVKKIEEDQHGFFSCGTSIKGRRVCIVYARTKPALVHEIAHLVIYVFEKVGIPINDSGSEAFAYMIEQLFRDSERIFERRRK